MTYYIAFDESHKPRGKIGSNYHSLQQHLESEEFVCQAFLDSPVTQKALQAYDIVVVPCPDFSKFSDQEIIDIDHWVREDGGGLLLLSHAGGDKGRRSNLSELSEKFGIIFESDQVLDDKYNCGMGNLPQVKDFTLHPITASLTELCFRAGCSLSTRGTAVAVASSGDQANPASAPVIVAAECDEGRVVGMGSYEIFRDQIGAGFSEGQHTQLASNIFNWLISDKRYQMRAQNKSPVPNPAGIAFAEIEHAAMFVPPSGTGAPPSLIGAPQGGQETQNYEVKSTIHINAKSDLARELNRMLGEFEELKGRLEAVIKAVVESPDVRELAPAKTSAFAMPQYESLEEALPEEEAPAVDVPASRSPAPARKRALTPPPEPPTFSAFPQVNAQFDDQQAGFGEATGEAWNQGSAMTSPYAAPAPSEEKASKEDLETELEVVQSKLISIQNLKGFVEKKYNSGKMDEASFKKQKSSLDSDLKRTQYHLDEIKGKLKKMG